MVDVSTIYTTTVTITECIPWRKKGGQALFTMDVNEDEAQSVLDSIRDRPDVISVDIVNMTDGQIIGSVAMQDCSWVWKIVECGCFLEQAQSIGDGKVNFKIFSGSEGSLPKLIKSMGWKGVDLDIIRIAQISNRPIITRRQESVIKLALERGYFDYPRKIKIEELARLSKMSPSAVFEIIKRGEKNILRQYFKEK